MKKRILLGITGSIAAYKIPDLIRKLKKQEYQVKVVLTPAAKNFVTPLSLQAVLQDKVFEQLMDSEAEVAMNHIELARWPDLILVAPATAHIMAKLANGFADELLTSVCLASTARLVLAPAMNQAMWLNKATQDNVDKLKQRGCLFLGPEEGIQACGDRGVGRMLEPLELVESLSKLFIRPFLQEQRLLITAGPTQEFIDPVRYLSNRSSGKMGFALAKAAIDAGAEVTLISGPVSLAAPKKSWFVLVRTAQEMLEAVQKEIEGHTVFISAAAVADYQVCHPTPQKIKKSTRTLTLQLKPTIDILTTVGKMKLKPKPLLAGFSAETEYTLKFAEEKRRKKGIDLMVVNDVSRVDIGFDSDENEVTVLSSGLPVYLKKAPKSIIAEELLRILACYLAEAKSNTKIEKASIKECDLIP